MENLLRQREELQNQVRELDNLSTTGTEKIFAAIKNQRWFFFKNNDYILLDRDTGLIWANLDYFPYKKNDSKKYYYSYENDWAEVKKLIDDTNLKSWGGFDGWRIPTEDELKKMIADKSFPFQEGEDWYIKNIYTWSAFMNNKLEGAGLSNEPLAAVFSPGELKSLTTGYKFGACVLPCNSTLAPHFTGSTQELLDIFVENDLIPIFEDYSVSQLYKKIYVDKVADKKTNLVKQINELDRKIAAAKKFAEEEEQRKKLEASKLKLTANFDYRPLLKNFDAAAIAKSPIKYFDALLNVADELLKILEEYGAAQKDTIAEGLKLTLKLKAKYVDDPKLTPEENFLLAERQKFLAQRFDLSTDAPAKKILSVKAQAENFFAQLDAINSDNRSIHDLAELQAEPRADFEFLVENLARIILDAQRKVDFFAANKNFVSAVVNFHCEWSDAYKSFKTGLREEFFSICRKENIGEEISAEWYEEWRTKRFELEEKFLPLVAFALKGNFLDAAEKILNVLRDYREAVDKFYMYERKNIFQKFEAEKFSRDLQEIISSRKKTEERIFLLRWSEPFFVAK